MLTSFFCELNTRKITPKVLDDVLKAGDFVENKKIISSFLALSFFSKQEATVEVLEAELKAYDEFKTRLKKIQHFVHTFAEISEGLIYNKMNNF